MGDEPKKANWTEAEQLAAELLAKGQDRREDIAQQVGIGVATLYRWMKNTEFMDEVNSRVEVYRNAVRLHGIGQIHRRVAAQHSRWERMQRVIQERGDDPEMANVPGGSTGLMVRTYKSVGSGDNATVVEEYSFDGSLSKAILEVERQAAQELGQWTEKTEISGDPDKPPILVTVLKTVSTDDL